MLLMQFKMTFKVLQCIFGQTFYCLARSKTILLYIMYRNINIKKKPVMSCLQSQQMIKGKRHDEC